VPPDEPGAFDVLGPRVPGFVISPFAKANYVSHVVHDHTSILKFIETKFNLGAMTYRDANADDLLDCFDFANPGFLDPPTLPEPGLPAAGSTCQPLPRPQTEPDFGEPPPSPPPPPATGPVGAAPPFTG
jgi:phospholipase C